MYIKQGFLFLTFKDNSKKVWRISRVYWANLYYRIQNIPNIKCAKLYDIPNYKKGKYHQIGLKIGFCGFNTKSGQFYENFNINGLTESTESINFKNNIINA